MNETAGAMTGEEERPIAPPRKGALAALEYLYRVLIPSKPYDRILYGSRFLAATEGRSFVRVFERFKADPTGQRILAQRPPFYDKLRDRRALAAAPSGSLARCYHEFLTNNGLDDLGLDEELAATSRAFGETEEMSWFRQRYAVMHDVRHLLTGYGADRPGEMCLLAFRYAQTGHPGLIAFAVLAAIGELLRFRPVVAAIREGYRRGRAAPLLDLLEWEAAPEKSLDEFRRSLGLRPPVHYRPERPAAA